MSEHQTFEQLMAQRYPQTNRASSSNANNTNAASNNSNNNAAISLQQQQQQQLARMYQNRNRGASGGGGVGALSSSLPSQLQQGSAASSSIFQQNAFAAATATGGGLGTSNNSAASGALAATSNSSKSGGATLKAAAAAATATKNQSSSATSAGLSPFRSPNAGLTFNTAQQRHNLVHCNWKDKLIWSTRIIFGGNSVNGFHRATSAVQRIKKQRARQAALTRRTQAANAARDAGLAPPEPPKKPDPKDKAKPFDPVEEEKLKKDIMNPRTAKKMKSEIEQGLQYCSHLHSILRGILIDIEPLLASHLPKPIMTSTTDDDQQHQQQQQAQVPPNYASLLQKQQTAAAVPPKNNNASVASSSSRKSKDSTKSTAPSSSSQTLLHSSSSKSGKTNSKMAATQQQQKQRQQQQQKQTSIKTTASPGDPSGSTLRKLRKKKLPPNTEAVVDIPEFDPSGRRVCSKKEHHTRIFKALRFRALKRGDFVAARLTSRDLWILAMVQKEYPTFDMYPVAFVKLTEQKRDALFKDKVVVQDVEDKDKNAASVPRNLVLPLPRTFSEAAEWAQRIKKGSRVYAMYPQTTSLYSATVIDSTTYCREDDDIIVVEFDGEEPDASGQVPKYHIPARFVTLIPKEFPASSAPTTSTGSGSSSSNKRRSSTAANQESNKKAKQDDLLLSMGSFDDGNFDSLDLDFDKPLDALDDQEDDFPPLI